MIVAIYATSYLCYDISSFEKCLTMVRESVTFQMYSIIICSVKMQGSDCCQMTITVRVSYIAFSHKWRNYEIFFSCRHTSCTIQIRVIYPLRA